MQNYNIAHANYFERTDRMTRDLEELEAFRLKTIKSILEKYAFMRQSMQQGLEQSIIAKYKVC